MIGNPPGYDLDKNSYVWVDIIERTNYFVTKHSLR